MADCLPLAREMLKDPIHLKVADGPVDFSQAKTMAERRAREAAPDPMLLAWYNRETGEFSPQVPCCRDDKPAWLAYAESRGADLIIDINDEAYVFVFKASP
jgi:hypothetical protein